MDIENRLMVTKKEKEWAYKLEVWDQLIQNTIHGIR